jgi:hypothetical protein
LSTIAIAIAITSPPAIEIAVVLLAVQSTGPVLSVLVWELASKAGCKVTKILGEIAFVVAIRWVSTKTLEEGLKILGQITIYDLWVYYPAKKFEVIIYCIHWENLLSSQQVLQWQR